MKPRIAILATGGTIAGVINDAISTTGYKAGALDIEVLLNAVPQVKEIASIVGYQVSNIDSSDMSNEIQLKLAKKINKLLAKDEIDAVVITHGTDTMEESAYFLHLTIKSDKPVILTGSMRPSTAMSADGSKNLYNAVALAINVKSKSKGVMIVMNDRILSARAAVKTHTLNLDAFSSPDFGDLGYILDGKVYFYNTIEKLHTKNTPFDIDYLEDLPKVDILYTYSNDGNGIAAKALFENGSQALVIAGSGSGNIHKNQKNILKELMKKNLIVAISSRIQTGEVILSKEDENSGFICAQDLNPQKARILLMLALTKTKDLKTIQNFFQTY
ncbi:type II asparaginase [Campylobacter sp. 2018MI35]|uniref:type II asparaginase n=1 Tax=Campylobacter molothri TaxID=1032242 RepID=UPI0019083A01|nr:type II asparaginase [Campylobacter sp. 2018MI35]MBK2001301.1 type II asparaginase [Campylobacter sp. 2018MI35]